MSTLVDGGALTQTLEMVRRLSHQEKLLVLHDLASDLQKEGVPAEGEGAAPLPVIHLPAWPENLPLRRAELYDDRSR